MKRRFDILNEQLARRDKIPKKILQKVKKCVDIKKKFWYI